MPKILINKAKCKKCNDIIISAYRHDFVECKCGAIAVDGGQDYLRRIGSSTNRIELSEFEDPDPNRTVQDIDKPVFYRGKWWSLKEFFLQAFE